MSGTLAVRTRRSSKTTLVLVACALSVLLTFLVWKHVVTQGDIVVTTVTYAPGLSADILSGPGGVSSIRRPAAILIHGGAWRHGSRKELLGLATLLVRQGFVSVLIDYRLTRNNHRWPAQAVDVTQAVWWMREHKDELHIDPNRIVAIGSSAGAHLAAWLAATDSINERGMHSRVNLLVSLWGPWDLSVPPSTLGVEGNEAISALLGALDPRAASPLWQVDRNAPPTLIVHGTDDEVVPPDQSKRACAALLSANVACTVIWLHGAGHVVKRHEHVELYETEIVNFLRRHFGPTGSWGNSKQP